MADSDSPAFDFDLGAHGGKINVLSGQDLIDWTAKEYAEWQWLHAGKPASDYVLEQHQAFHNQVNGLAHRWRKQSANLTLVQPILDAITETFQNFYCSRRILHSSAPEVPFLKKIREERGDVIACGAYVMLLPSPISLGSPMPAGFAAGLFEGFLFGREIDWTASTHQEVLNHLRQEYASAISDQKVRLTEIEQRNGQLNNEFEGALKQRLSALEELHANQAGAFAQLHSNQSLDFKKLIDEHVKNLTRIEKTYDQKLALQKPVKYWQTKREHHGRRARSFSIAAGVTGGLLAAGMAGLCFWILSDLGPDQNPRACLQTSFEPV